MSAHTPGPWRVDYAMNEVQIRAAESASAPGHTIICGKKGRRGARRGERVHWIPFSEQDKADHALIGSAPDLYEALRRAMPFVMDAENGDPALVKAIAAALAKAEGRP